MCRPLQNFTRAHAVIFVLLWALFGSLAFYGLYGNSASRQRGRVTITTAATITGPMAGAVYSRYHRSMVQVGLSLMPYFLPPLVGAIAAQFVPLPRRRWATMARLLVWFVGLSAWFAGSAVSLLVALS